jgi:fucose permease
MLHPLVWLQVVTFFTYTGLELMVGHWSFTLLTESRAMLPDRAGLIVSSYFGAICAGRVVLGSVADRVGVDRLVRYSTIVACLGAAILAFSASISWSTAGLLILGLSLATIFPCLMARTPDRLGRDYAAHAVGFQVCAAMTGAAVIPAVAGVLAGRYGLESVALLGVILALLLCFLHETLLLVSGRRANAPGQLAKSS